MTKRLCIGLTVCVTGLAGVARADTLRVPSERTPDIATALEISRPGDRIRLADGVHLLPSGVHDVSGVTIEGPRSFRPTLYGEHGPRQNTRDGYGDRAVLTGTATLRGDGIAIRNVTLRLHQAMDPKRSIASLTIVGDNATFSRSNVRRGALEIRGDHAGVSRSIVDRGSTLCVRGNDATLKRLHAREGYIEGAAVTLRGDRHRIERCKFTDLDDALSVQGDGTVMRRNRYSDIGWSARIDGDDAHVESNRFADVDAAITIAGDRAVVDGNRTRFSVQGVVVEGDAFRIQSNRLGMGARVFESRDDPNREGARRVFVGLAPGCPGVVARAEGAGAVVDNHVRRVGGDGFVVEMNGGVVSGNTDSARRLGGESFAITGNENTVTENRVIGAGTCGISVLGNRNVVSDNTLRRGAGDGLAIDGAHNLISENHLTGFDGSSVIVDGYSNEIVGNQAVNGGANGIVVQSGVSNLVQDCVVRGCDGAGLLNLALSTRLDESTFTGNTPDVSTTRTLLDGDGSPIDPN